MNFERGDSLFSIGTFLSDVLVLYHGYSTLYVLCTALRYSYTVTLRCDCWEEIANEELQSSESHARECAHVCVCLYIHRYILLNEPLLVPAFRDGVSCRRALKLD